MEDRKVFGDFQTPQPLANRLCQLVQALGIKPDIIVDPTCGIGAFLVAAAEVFPDARLVGRDISPLYVHTARKRLPTNADVEAADFFGVDWASMGKHGTLFVGNPPWVTSAELTKLDATNDPTRDNLKRLRGMDALTGKSNFDISEWMLLRLLLALQRSGGTVAMICKASVARKVLEFAAANHLCFEGHGLWKLDAAQEFDTSVNCGFLVFSAPPQTRRYALPVFADWSQPPNETWEWVDGLLVRDGAALRHNRTALGPPGSSDWRSGIKHDCRGVLELEHEGRAWRNARGALLDVEDDLIFPFLKATDLFHGRMPHLGLLVTQHAVGEDTTWIAQQLPKTWAYLSAHRSLLAARKSRIYHGRPAFSIFGVGDYSFKPWKVAVSGLHKEPRFRLVGPYEGKPVMLDDTSYSLGFDREEDARMAMAHLMNGHLAELLKAMVFPDNKRPFTKAILSRLKIPAAVAAQSSRRTAAQVTLAAH